MKTALILNPVSGNGKAIKLLPKIQHWAEINRVKFELFVTQKPGDGYSFSRLCLIEGYNKIVVAGGDGTINEVGSAIIDSDIVLGVVPGGSGNDFFKMIGNNSNINNVFNTAFKGKAKNIDFGTINGTPFFNMVGVGFDAEVARQREKAPTLKGILGYLLAVFKTWHNLKHYDIQLELDEAKIDDKITLISIGNGRCAGGGFYLTPQAKINDDLLDICIINALPKKKIFQYLPKTMKGSHVRLPGVQIYRSRKVIIRSIQKIPYHVDGKPYNDNIKELILKIDHRKLKVSFPKEIKN